MRVLKFGGTSLATADRVAGVAAIVSETAARESVVVVVSAFGGVTNALVEAARQAVRADARWAASLEELEKRHIDAALALALPGELDALVAFVKTAFVELRGFVNGASLVGECTPRTMDSVMSYGERLAAPCVAASLRRAGLPAEAFDARSAILTNNRFGAARVRLAESYARIHSAIRPSGAVPVVTGFIGATSAGETTTLGRGGSDYTAALFGAAVDATAIEIWTDVNGVMSADPRLVRDAFSIPALSYDELMELSHFGAKVVYPPTVHPAREKKIPLIIRNTLNPSFPGTVVSTQSGGGDHAVRGISSIPRVALLRLEGDGMVGVPGIASRLFGALATESISVVLITQASSEHSICFAIEPEGVERAFDRLQSEFALERGAGLVDDVVVEDDVALVAVVGEGMHERAGVAGRIFGILAREGINVRAISQGSSELNITVAVSRTDETAAVRNIHDVFFAPGHVSVALAVAGAGRVGTALLDQIAARRDFLAAEGLRLDLIGIGRSTAGRLEPGGLPWASWRAAEWGPVPLADIAAALHGRGGYRLFVDCTASDAPTAFYESFLSSGVDVVTANKRAFAADLATYTRLKTSARRASLRYEATVGAGLPVLSTLADLIATGDVVHRIEGCLSGTIGFVLDRLAAGVAFSEAVREAHASGYTEPHPRDDLDGADVARKLLILARDAGFAAEADAVQVESLLPGEQWSSLSLEDFWRELPAIDDHYRAKAKAAAAASRKLSFVATATAERCAATLELIGPEHPCWSLSGTDNLVAFWTARYAKAPLVVRGPGAGPAVTAAAVFADILRAVGHRH